MEKDIYSVIFTIATALLIAATIANVIRDKKHPKSGTFQDYFLEILRGVDLTNKLLSIGGLGLYIWYYVVRGGQVSAVEIEVSIILAVIAVSSSVFPNYTAGHKINSTGVLHWSLIGIGAVATTALLLFPYEIKKGTNAEYYVDSLSHSITFLLAVFGLFGNTTDAEGNLNANGRTVCLMLIVSSAFAFLTSIRSIEGQHESQKKLERSLKDILRASNDAQNGLFAVADHANQILISLPKLKDEIKNSSTSTVKSVSLNHKDNMERSLKLYLDPAEGIAVKKHEDQLNDIRGLVDARNQQITENSELIKSTRGQIASYKTEMEGYKNSIVASSGNLDTKINNLHTSVEDVLNKGKESYLNRVQRLIKEGVADRDEITRLNNRENQLKAILSDTSRSEADRIADARKLIQRK